MPIITNMILETSYFDVTCYLLKSPLLPPSEKKKWKEFRKLVTFCYEQQAPLNWGRKRFTTTIKKTPWEGNHWNISSKHDFRKYIAYINHIPTNELYCITFLFIHSLIKLTLHLAHSNTPIILFNMHESFIYSFSV